MSDQIKELVVKLRDTIMTSRGLGQFDEELVNPDGPEAADALEAMADEVERLKRMLFPYAEDKEISGVTWNGFYLIGNKKSIDEFKRLENRAAQLETYRAEFVRRNEAAEAERDRLKAALEKIEQGDYPRDGRNYYNSRLLPSKHDTCVHSKAYWEDCGNCCSLFARKALGGDAS